MASFKRRGAALRRLRQNQRRRALRDKVKGIDSNSGMPAAIRGAYDKYADGSLRRGRGLSMGTTKRLRRNTKIKAKRYQDQSQVIVDDRDKLRAIVSKGSFNTEIEQAMLGGNRRSILAHEIGHMKDRGMKKTLKRNTRVQISAVMGEINAASLYGSRNARFAKSILTRERTANRNALRELVRAKASRREIEDFKIQARQGFNTYRRQQIGAIVGDDQAILSASDTKKVMRKFPHLREVKAFSSL